MSDPVEDLANAATAFGPKSVTTDGTTVTNHSVGDLIKAAEYIKAQNRSRTRNPLRTHPLSPPGTQ